MEDSRRCLNPVRLTSGKAGGWLSEGRTASTVSLSQRWAEPAGVWGGVVFLGDGLWWLSELGVRGLRLEHRQRQTVGIRNHFN